MMWPDGEVKLLSDQVLDSVVVGGFQRSRWTKGDEASLAKCLEVPESCSAEVDETREMGSMIKREVLAELKGRTK